MQDNGTDGSKLNELEETSAWKESENPLDDPGERDVLFAALDAFCQYRSIAHNNITHRRRQNFYALPSEQWKLLAAPPFNLLDHLSAVDDAIDINADLADAIGGLAVNSFDLPLDGISSDPSCNWRNKAKFNDHTKAHSTLRQFYRDWTAAGYAAEIKPAVDLFLSDFATHLSSSGETPNILLPGAGLGRLLLCLCLAGYNCTGNEISWHQLLASNFILNATTSANSHTIYPFVSTFTNNLSSAAQLRAFTIPDIHPATAIDSLRAQGKQVGEMSMTSGDFITSYNGPDQKHTFDAIITHFFIDTAPNLFRYISTIQNCLKPNGLWLNIGPLLWHFDDRSPHDLSDTSSPSASNTSHTNTINASPINTEDTGIAEPGSFSLPHDLVLELVRRSGFEILKQEILADDVAGSGGYITDPESMLQTRYRNAHWVARKMS